VFVPKSQEGEIVAGGKAQDTGTQNVLEKRMDFHLGRETSPADLD